MTFKTEAKKEAEKQAQEYKARAGDCLATFTSAHGRRILKDMRKTYCSYTFDADPCVHAFNAGKMQVIKDIEAMLILGKSPQKIDDLFRQPEDDGFDF